MKKQTAVKAKPVRKAVRADDVWHPPPHPPRKHPPKNNLGHVPALFRKLGPGFRVPGRPAPRIGPSAARQ